MDSLDNELVEKVRSLTRRGDQPSALLRTIISYLSPATADRIVLVRYFAAAFAFTEGESYPIFGWFPDGSGELKDADIDRIMSKRIRQTRTEWDKPDPSSRHAS
jgi:hypothetical protein